MNTKIDSAQHSTAQHSTAQHSTAQHSTAQHSTAQHSTAQAVFMSRFRKNSIVISKGNVFGDVMY